MDDDDNNQIHKTDENDDDSPSIPNDPPSNNQIQENNKTDLNSLTLSLNISPAHNHAYSTNSDHASTSRQTTTIQSPPLPPPHLFYPFFYPPPESDPPPTPTRPTQRPPRRNPTRTPPPGKSATIQRPYPWAGERRCAVRAMTDLQSHKILYISGDLKCKKCDGIQRVEYDLEEKFRQLAAFIAENVGNMNARAPKIWMSPALPDCPLCNEKNSAKPVISDKKKTINWLFLFLGQMLGCCTLHQLRYFCKHNTMHRTGAKDRLLFSTYLELCNQLQPNGPSI